MTPIGRNAVTELAHATLQRASTDNESRSLALAVLEFIDDAAVLDSIQARGSVDGYRSHDQWAFNVNGSYLRGDSADFRRAYALAMKLPDQPSKSSAPCLEGMA